MEEKIALRRIKDPSPSELEQIALLYIDCFNDKEKAENWDIRTAREYFLERLNEKNEFYCLIDKNNQISSVVMGGDFSHSFLSQEINVKSESSFYISLVMTDRKFRKKNFLNYLMKEVENRAKNDDYQSFITRCRSNNYAVQRLFGKNGFEYEMEYTSELGGVTCKRLILKKDFYSAQKLMN